MQAGISEIPREPVHFRELDRSRRDEHAADAEPLSDRDRF